MNRALLLGQSVLLFSAQALGQSPSGNDAASSPRARLDPDAPPLTVHVVDDAEPKPPLVARSRDLLGSHLLVGAAVGPAWSLGRLGSSVPASRGLGTGLGFRADAGFGVSRSVVLGLWGSYAGYTDGQHCSSCSGKAFALGPFVRYHLSQGL